jgi:hypothetical protein
MIGGERKQSTSPALYFLASVFLSRSTILAYWIAADNKGDMVGDLENRCITKYFRSFAVDNCASRRVFFL